MIAWSGWTTSARGDMKTERHQGMDPTVISPENLRRATQPDGGALSNVPLTADADAFEQEFSRPRAEDEEQGDQDSDDARPPPTPFELLPSSRLPSTTAGDGASSQGITQSLLNTVQQWYVSDARSTKRQVRMRISQDVLPGVTLSVSEDAGRVVVEFVCTVESSREWLSQCAERLAGALATRLNRETRMFVRRDDPEDPCLVQAVAAPMDHPPSASDGAASSSVDRRRGSDDA